MANIQKFESIKGNIFYVTMFDGETVTLPHQNIQNNTIALIRGNGVVALSSGETTIHGSASFLYYNNKWNYVTPEVTREKLNQAIETLSEELGSEIDRIDGEITEIQGDLEELNPLKPQEYVLEVVPETGLNMVSYQAYRVGKVVFIFLLVRNNTDNVITIETRENTIQLVGGNLKRDFGLLDVTRSNTKFTPTDTNFIGPTTPFSLQPNTNDAIYGFLFTN